MKHADHAIDLMNVFLSVTLSGDVDFAFSGMDAEQRKKDRDPRVLLVGIINDGGPSGMDEQEVYDKMDDEGYTRPDVEKYLEKLRNEGRLLKDGYDKWRPGEF